MLDDLLHFSIESDCTEYRSFGTEYAENTHNQERNPT